MPDGSIQLPHKVSGMMDGWKNMFSGLQTDFIGDAVPLKYFEESQAFSFIHLFIYFSVRHVVVKIAGLLDHTLLQVSTVFTHFILLFSKLGQ